MESWWHEHMFGLARLFDMFGLSRLVLGASTLFVIASGLTLENSDRERFMVVSNELSDTYSTK
jgi:hypothetical protein